MCVSSTAVTRVPELSSTQEECDTRIVLHTLYSIHKLGARRVVVHGNDIDIIVMLLHYVSQLDKDVEVWVKRETSEYVPVHELSQSLGPRYCRLLPFVHAFSGKDDVSSLYGIGKCKMLKLADNVDTAALASIGETESVLPSEEAVTSARTLLMAAYGGKDFTSLSALRAHLFIIRDKGDLQCLPPTEASFRLHFLRSVIATTEQKRAHLPNQNLPPATDFGWQKGEFGLQPTTMSCPPFPAATEMLVSCKCTISHCNRNCSCRAARVSCCIACRCEGKESKCGRVHHLHRIETSSDE